MVVQRTWHAATALLAGTGVVMEVVVALLDGPGEAGSMLERLVRLFSYFTILSNVLVCVVAVLLAVRPDRDGRVFRVARLDAILCIAVTGIVYNTVLRGLVELSAAGAVSNLLLHVLSPLAVVVGWVLFGPRPRIDRSTIGWSLVAPLAWIAYTFVRGEIVGWYPYPFLDAAEDGYASALLSTLVVAVVFLVLAAGAGWLDQRMKGGADSPGNRQERVTSGR
ncbi:Pr6Pr family membrane protein [Sanguibacter sp. 4.1]|uniref:Pr6Pr family membrane protein n=1 Tax=Sanguibacter biliveldensis TaxID=3030830 RepID=A0AAF0Z6K9_9MICO|nr:Pr6Pr family membrane protein [Sanguibacter sp. 4.1]WPF81866.1 Pr6Pr family membrane protein [Sanguibacter sp. 4.1]